MSREPQQMFGQLADCLAPELPDGLRGMCRTLLRTFEHAGPLPLNPWALLLCEQLSVAAGSPSRNGDTDASIGTDSNDIAPGRGMADEIHERITIVPSGTDPE